jgi:hypothetical protein
MILPKSSQRLTIVLESPTALMKRLLHTLRATNVRTTSKFSKGKWDCATLSCTVATTAMIVVELVHMDVVETMYHIYSTMLSDAELSVIASAATKSMRLFLAFQRCGQKYQSFNSLIL